MNEITGIKQHFDLLIFRLIIEKLQKLGTKIDGGDKDRFDPTVSVCLTPLLGADIREQSAYELGV